MARVLPFCELREKKGIEYSRKHLRRKVRDGSFPSPIRLGDRRIAWHEHEIDAWLADRPTVGAAMAT
jgi:predicted DNA-binding transcriptional regulator AlpA